MICKTKNTVVLVILVTSDNSFLEIGTPSRLIRKYPLVNCHITMGNHSNLASHHFSTRMDGTSQAILAGELAWTPMVNMP